MVSVYFLQKLDYILMFDGIKDFCVIYKTQV